MLNQDDDFDNDEDLNEPNRISRKKILVFLIPALIAIGLGVGFFYAFNHKFGNNGNANYSIVRNIIEEDGKEAESVTVFYDLPEITARLKDTSADEATGTPQNQRGVKQCRRRRQNRGFAAPYQRRRHCAYD